ncbi:MAG: helix-hairpin-helix domain-containing protein [Lachnospiraceae bacterium]|nr:helix-hairpin-helix domain-containing protein [Lachnospiraceae bacterium]
MNKFLFPVFLFALSLLLGCGNSRATVITQNTKQITEDIIEEEPAFPVNINTADLDTLMTLKGIGRVKAEAILSYRNEHGGFSELEELMLISGIKEGTFAKIRDYITLR